MTFSPLIDFLARQQLTTLVKPADVQHDDDRVACFCPFCKGTTPHFIIYRTQFGGMYSGKGAQRWMCTRTQQQGYGALELYAAIHGLSLEGESLRKACIGLLNQLGYKEEDVRRKFPEEHPYDRLLVRYEEQEQQVFTFEPMAELTAQAMHALGCETWIEHGVPRLSLSTSESYCGQRPGYTPRRWEPAQTGWEPPRCGGSCRGCRVRGPGFRGRA